MIKILTVIFDQFKASLSNEYFDQFLKKKKKKIATKTFLNATKK